VLKLAKVRIKRTSETLASGTYRA